MHNDEFEIQYEVDDGYVGSRPQTVTIGDYDVLDLDENELKRLFWDTIEDDFQQKCRPYSDQESEFVAWAKERQEELRDEDTDGN